MKIKDIVAKTTYVVLIAKEKDGTVICDSVGYLGDYEKYKDATVKSIEPFHTRSGLYKDGFLCIIKNNKDE